MALRKPSILLALLTAGAVSSAQAVKLNAELPAGPGLGSVQTFRLTPDESRVVYLSDLTTPGSVHLFQTARGGSTTPLQLDGGKEPTTFGVTPDGTRVVFDDGINVVSIDGGPVTELVPGPTLPGSTSGIRDVSDTFAVYVSPRYQLYSVLLNGSSAPVLLHDAGTVNIFRQLQIVGTRVVYEVSDNTGYYSLYTVPIDGSAPPAVLNDMARVMGFEVTPDGQRVLFWAGSSSAGLTHRLFSTRPDGSTAPVLLSPSLDQYSVSMVRTLTSDGTKVVFVAQITAALAGLFVAPVDGSTPTQPLPTPPYSAFGIAKFNPDPDTVYFSTKDPAVGVNRLYRVPIDGSSSPLLLADLSPLGATSLAVSHDGSTLLFVADDRPNSLSELYSLPTSGGAITRLSPALTSSLQVNQSWVTETDRALFTIGGSDWGELFSVPLDGSEASVSLSPGRRATLGGRTPYVASLAPVLTSSAVVFAADSGPWTPDQLFASAIDASSAPVELTPEVTPGPSDRDVAVTVLLTPDGQHALYSVDQEINDVEYLYSVALTPPYEVHQLTDFEAFASLVTPDSARVLFSTGSQLYSVRVDGSEAPIPLGAPGAILGFELTPDGQRVVYLQSDRLYVVPVDGSLAPYPLDPFDRALRAKGQFRVNPNGLSVVYVAALSGGDTRARLFHLSLDGSTNPKHLSGTFQSQGNLSFLPDSGRFQLSPDGSRVVYWGDLVVDGRTDLYSSPVEGSTGRLTLVTPGVPDSTLRDDFRISPDSTRLVYRADSDVVNRVELFSVRLDGVGGVVKLSPTLAPRRDVHPSLSFTPDGSQVIYVSDQDADIRGPAGMSSRSRPALELYRVPIDGSGPSVRLSGPLLRGEGIRSSNTGSVFAVDPVNERVVYLLELASGNARRWMSAPLDGSRAAVPLSPALKQAAAYLLDDGDLVFAEGTGRLGRFNLYRASTLGTSPALRLNSPADTVQGFYGATVFRGDLEAPERDELFLYPLGP